MPAKIRTPDALRAERTGRVFEFEHGWSASRPTPRIACYRKLMHSPFDIPESKARALLAHPMRCEDCGGWRRERTHPSTLKVVAGLIDGSGARTESHVELACRQIPRAHGSKAGACHYVFSVYWRNLGKVNRVYQLDVEQSAQRFGEVRGVPHEHFGDCKIVGEAAWRSWSFQQLLGHFCLRTNIGFSPWPDDPKVINTKGKK